MVMSDAVKHQAVTRCCRMMLMHDESCLGPEAAGECALYGPLHMLIQVTG